MLNLIDAGSTALTNAEDEVVRYGIALSRVDSAKVEAANDAMFRIQQRASGIGNVIAAKTAPIVTALANRFLDSGDSADSMGEVVDDVINGIGLGVGVVLDAFHGWKIILKGVSIASIELSET